MVDTVAQVVIGGKIGGIERKEMIVSFGSFPPETGAVVLEYTD